VLLRKLSNNIHREVRLKLSDKSRTPTEEHNLRTSFIVIEFRRQIENNK